MYIRMHITLAINNFLSAKSINVHEGYVISKQPDVKLSGRAAVCTLNHIYAVFIKCAYIFQKNDV